MHQLWRDNRPTSKDETERREFKDQEARLIGKLTLAARVVDEVQAVDDWLPEGLPDSAPSWW